ncbi:hypothetical protein KFE25_001122 [Diacronema lutheri]|uniref:Multiple myeloma tumor-associated protein 2-like N-terminal domain-containing protein n=1 Tax=Diacronema lutheri TaxID=2081491 RepID=A0A8J5XD38_DIALT|nr:hypothetical protein KFE25_001122 [Diacronema lutheri]
MYDGPPRGGTRGGADQFKWEDVKNDKYRECYLGHSVKAPTGRWQQGRSLDWYAKSGSTLGLDEDLQALRRERDEVKRQEQEMMRQALGLAPVDTEREGLAPGEARELLRSAGAAGSGQHVADGLGFGGAGTARGAPARDAHGGVRFEPGERTLADVWRTREAAPPADASAPSMPGARMACAERAERARSPGSSSSSSSSSEGGSASSDERGARKRKLRAADDDRAGKRASTRGKDGKKRTSDKERKKRKKETRSRGKHKSKKRRHRRDAD